MARSSAEELRHFAQMIAALVVTASRPDLSNDHRREIHDSLAEHLEDVFGLLAHDSDVQLLPALMEGIARVSDGRTRSYSDGGTR